MVYTFFLKNEKTKTYTLISQLLVVFNLAAFSFLLTNSENVIKNNLWLILAIFACAVYVSFAIIENIRKEQIHDLWHRTVLLYCAVAWSRTDFWQISILVLVLVILDKLALRKQIVKVSVKNITVPYIIDKEIDWQSLNNVILKDGLLTIDFKNDKLFQQYILNSDVEVNEKEFNDFCHKQLNK